MTIGDRLYILPRPDGFWLAEDYEDDESETHETATHSGPYATWAEAKLAIEEVKAEEDIEAEEAAWERSRELYRDREAVRWRMAG